MSDTSGARERSLSWSGVILPPVYFSKLLHIERPSLSLGAVDCEKGSNALPFVRHKRPARLQYCSRRE